LDQSHGIIILIDEAAAGGAEGTEGEKSDKKSETK
jgi:hypothetical protein